MASWAHVLAVAVVGLAHAVPQLARPKLLDTIEDAATVPASCGWAGWQIARLLLNEGGAPGVYLEEIGNKRGDHYNSEEKVVRLSPHVYRGSTIFAVAVAAHEAGHAIQDATDDPAYVRHVRTRKIARGITPVIDAARFAGAGVPFAGLAWTAISRAIWVARLGVERDASDRGIALLRAHRLLTRDDEERAIRDVLDSGWVTYASQ